MDDMQVEWAAPPAPPGPRTRAKQVDQVVQQLRQRPGEWAVVESEGDSVRLSNAAQPYRARGCQITVQGGRLFARWPQ